MNKDIFLNLQKNIVYEIENHGKLNYTIPFSGRSYLESVMTVVSYHLSEEEINLETTDGTICISREDLDEIRSDYDDVLNVVDYSLTINGMQIIFTFTEVPHNEGLFYCNTVINQDFPLGSR